MSRDEATAALLPQQHPVAANKYFIDRTHGFGYWILHSILFKNETKPVYYKQQRRTKRRKKKINKCVMTTKSQSQKYQQA